MRYGNSPGGVVKARYVCMYQRRRTCKSASHFCWPIGSGRQSLSEVAHYNLTLSGTS